MKRIITIEIKAKSEEQITWAMMIFRPMIIKARKEIVEDGLEIIMIEEEN